MAASAQTPNHSVTMADGPPHPYHLVDPSPWPIFGAFAAGVMAIGGVLFMHGSTSLLFCFGLASVLGVMFFWWRDVIKESVGRQLHSAVVKIGLRYGMSLFIASEVMFFVAFFWAFFASALYPHEGIGGVWPPATIKPVDPFELPFTMTMILLLSGCTVTSAHHAILHNKNSHAVRMLGITVLLGIAFTGFQVFEYYNTQFGFKDTIFASTFFMATGFHGFHVLIGTIFLIVCWWRCRKGHFTPASHFGFEAAAWYWHFVDVVWLFLFISVYWWGGR